MSHLNFLAIRFSKNSKYCLAGTVTKFVCLFDISIKLLGNVSIACIETFILEKNKSAYE